MSLFVSGKPLHNCSMSPQEIREEVEVLKTDFNNRMKQILFSSVLNAYYAGFVPCCFAQVITVKMWTRTSTFRVSIYFCMWLRYLLEQCTKTACVSSHTELPVL
jgi:hypothetical protein